MICILLGCEDLHFAFFVVARRVYVNELIEINRNLTTRVELNILNFNDFYKQVLFLRKSTSFLNNKHFLEKIITDTTTTWVKFRRLFSVQEFTLAILL